MIDIVSNYLRNLEFGKMQTHENLYAIPLFTSFNGSPEYLSLDEAMNRGLIIVKEVSQGGSVPELTVINNAELPVLLLDGEELAGAKQNRVINTTILLREKSQTVIPVSCTEQGRWHYVSNSFKSSGFVASPTLRQRKAKSVSDSLHLGRGFRSNQSEVWHTIASLEREARVESETGAMKDVFTTREKDIKGYLKNIKPVSGQKGLVVFLNHTLVGMDFVSRENVFETLHNKLIKSYALEALWQPVEKVSLDNLEKAREFITKLLSCKEKQYPSVGYGTDYRYQGKQVVGSALVYEDKVIHMAFFSTEESIEEIGNISSPRRRRNYRRDEVV